MTGLNSYSHLTQWQWINSPANTNLHSARWDTSPLPKKQIFFFFFYESFYSGFIVKFLFIHLLSCCLLLLLLQSHIFQIFAPPFISDSSALLHSPLWLFFSPPLFFFFFFFLPLGLTDLYSLRSSSFRQDYITFRSFSSLESNCSNKSLRQLEPYMVLSLVLGVRNSRRYTRCLIHSSRCQGRSVWAYEGRACSHKSCNYFKWAHSGKVGWDSGLLGELRAFFFCQSLK